MKRNVIYFFVLLLRFFSPCLLFGEGSGTLYVAHIIAVIDGDTVRIRFCGTCPDSCKNIETVRLIGVDTPELYTKIPEFYSHEARDFTDRYWRDPVFIELDPVTGLRDKYHRLLAYVWVSPKAGCCGDMLNRLLILYGYGCYYNKFQFKNSRMRYFRKAQMHAKKLHLGIWQS